MNKKSTFTSKFQLSNTLGFLVISVLTLGIINPFGWSFFRFLSTNAISIMFLLLGTGIIAVFLRKNFMILTSFLACITVCAYLKNAQNSNFAYAPLSSQSEINIASFVLNNLSSIDEFKQNIANLDADLISVQVPSQFLEGEWLDEKTKTDFPYCQKTICGDSLAVVIFSTNLIHDLDTLCFDNSISIAGNIKIDGMNKEVAFICTHMPNEEVHTKKQLALLSSYIQENYSNKPLLTMSGTEVKSWMPEMQKFRATNSLKDSRMDIDLLSSNKHIFYSKDLVCTNFSNILGGMGLVATYQLKAPKNVKTL